jgi:hypothetical protein
VTEKRDENVTRVTKERDGKNVTRMTEKLDEF